MGIAAYNRGSQAIRERINQDARPREFEVIDFANSLAKYPDAGTPFGPIEFCFLAWWLLGYLPAYRLRLLVSDSL